MLPELFVSTSNSSLAESTRMPDTAETCARDGHADTSTPIAIKQPRATAREYTICAICPPNKPPSTINISSTHPVVHLPSHVPRGSISSSLRLGTKVCFDAQQSIQDFYFAILAQCRLYIQPPLLELFLSFSPSRTTPTAQEGANSGSSGVRKNLEVPYFKRFLAHLTVPLPPFDLFASPLRRPIRSAPPAPQSAGLPGRACPADWLAIAFV